MIPYKLDVVMNRWPWMNLALIAATTVISFWGFAAEFNESELVSTFYQWHGERFRVYQLLTCIFFHAGFLHLAGNMLFLFVFGNAVNAKLGHFQYLLLYLAAGIIASVASQVIGSGTIDFHGMQIPVPSVGASGAIMGVVGAVLVLYPRNDVSTVMILMMRIFTFELSVGWLILLYVASDIFGSVRGGGNVDYLAHVGGAFFGIASIGALVWYNIIESSPNEQNLFQVLGWKPSLVDDGISAEEAFAARRAKERAAATATAARPTLKSFLIQGSDRSTGFKTNFEVKARDLDTARALAEKEDIVPEKIVEVLS